MIRIIVTDDRSVKGSKSKFRSSIKITLSELCSRRGRSKFIKNKAMPFLYNTLKMLRDK